jgi:hypothetical protein
LFDVFDLISDIEVAVGAARPRFGHRYREDTAGPPVHSAGERLTCVAPSKIPEACLRRL